MQSSSKRAEETWEQTKAHFVLLGAKPDKCGTLIKSLKQQCTLGKEAHPKTADSMKSALADHQWDPAHKENQKQRQEQRSKSLSRRDKEDQQLQFAQAGIKGVVC